MALTTALTALALTAPGAAVALPVPTVVTAVPVNTYLPKVMVTSTAGGLEFLNLDLNRHDLVAEVETEDGEVRPDHVRPSSSAPWCASFEDEPCPLFWTDLLGTGESAVVEGLADAVPGTTYHFFCTIHPYMQGELVVID